MFHRTNRRGRAATISAALVLGLVAVAGCSSAPKNQNGLKPAGKIARDDLTIFSSFFVVAAIIGIGVVLGTVFVALRFRERPGNENPKQTHGNSVLEISWTIVPALILAVMAVFTVRMIWDQAAKPTNQLDITVTGKQWWWQYQYTNYTPGSPFGAKDSKQQVVTANELHIPAGVPVWITLKSDNVNHSFWIPALAGTKDTINGHLNHLKMIADEDAIGKTFYGQCKQYCGLSHADMRATAKVQSKADFDTWYRSQLEPWTTAQFAKWGEFNKQWGCSSCHYIQGLAANADGTLVYDKQADADVQSGKTPVGPALGPNLTHLKDRDTFASGKYSLRDDKGQITDEFLTQWIWDAPLHGTGDTDKVGKPNSCPTRNPDGTTGAGTKCQVGMPSFKNDPLHPMTEQQAKEIADFLLGIDQ